MVVLMGYISDEWVPVRKAEEYLSSHEDNILPWREQYTTMHIINDY